MLLYNDLTQQITTTALELVSDFSDSRVLARLDKSDRIREIQKFCAFKFPGLTVKAV